MKDKVIRCSFFTLIVYTSALFTAKPVLAQQKLGAPPGKGSYMRYCASCHGDDGKGDGPVAPLLTPKPADLTQISKKSNSTFPTQRIASIIDGREEIAAHGPRDMPVWGERFGEAGRAAGSHVTETAARERIQLLLQYLSSIQEK